MLTDADGREIKVGSVVTHTQDGNGLSGKTARVIEIAGRSVILDLKIETRHRRTPRSKEIVTTIPPVFLGSLVRVVVDAD